MKVESLMTLDVRTCRAADSLAVAAGLMWEQDIGVVPVVDDSRHLQGIVTDRDLAMACLHQAALLSAIRVEDVMTRDVATCAPGDSLADATAQMRRRRVRRLPVVDAADHVVGLLSLNDLALASRDDGPEGLRPAEVARTLGAVSTHRLSVV